MKGLRSTETAPEGVQIRAIACDSRQCGPGTLFFALQGDKQDGNAFLNEAFARGCAVAVTDRAPQAVTGALLIVPDARAAMALASANLYGRPSESLYLAGVTGTSGKTTTSHLIDGVLRGGVGNGTLFGTIRHRVAGRAIASHNTTPESFDLNAWLRESLDAGVTSAVMEVSSHALALKRVHGLVFSAAVFTNLTRDHLDFHKTEEGYLRTKRLLFSDYLKADGIAIINADDAAAPRFIEKSRGRVLTYSIKDPCATVFPLQVEPSAMGTRLVLRTPAGNLDINSRLKGPFNVYNIMAAVTVAVGAGIPADRIVAGIESVAGVPGRFESVDNGEGVSVIVDYAHKPDALEKVLEAARAVTRGRLIAVFGCGGDRDRGKRPLMGAIAERLADHSFVTSDNPRTEAPEAILREIVSGLKDASKREVIADRRAAIRTAVQQAREGDTIVIAGKGHEDYQIIGTIKHHFDDREVAREALKEKYGTPVRQA
ncbi:MAG: UDP-N-acetylmuramoyl-L-alanyl-D-glutamate--2,6-diaminopimelate ligase [Fibrobacterota bacterium]